MRPRPQRPPARVTLARSIQDMIVADVTFPVGQLSPQRPEDDASVASSLDSRKPKKDVVPPRSVPIVSPLSSKPNQRVGRRRSKPRPTASPNAGNKMAAYDSPLAGSTLVSPVRGGRTGGGSSSARRTTPLRRPRTASTRLGNPQSSRPSSLSSSPARPRSALPRGLHPKARASPLAGPGAESPPPVFKTLDPHPKPAKWQLQADKAAFRVTPNLRADPAGSSARHVMGNMPDKVDGKAPSIDITLQLPRRTRRRPRSAAASRQAPKSARPQALNAHGKRPSTASPLRQPRPGDSSALPRVQLSPPTPRSGHPRPTPPGDADVLFPNWAWPDTAAYQSESPFAAVSSRQPQAESPVVTGRRWRKPRNSNTTSTKKKKTTTTTKKKKKTKRRSPTHWAQGDPRSGSQTGSVSPSRSPSPSRSHSRSMSRSSGPRGRSASPVKSPVPPLQSPPPQRPVAPYMPPTLHSSVSDIFPGASTTSDDSSPDVGDDDDDHDDDGAESGLSADVGTLLPAYADSESSEDVNASPSGFLSAEESKVPDPDRLAHPPSSSSDGGSSDSSQSADEGADGGGGVGVSAGAGAGAAARPVAGVRSARPVAGVKSSSTIRAGGDWRTFAPNPEQPSAAGTRPGLRAGAHERRHRGFPVRRGGTEPPRTSGAAHHVDRRLLLLHDGEIPFSETDKLGRRRGPAAIPSSAPYPPAVQAVQALVPTLLETTMQVRHPLATDVVGGATAYALEAARAKAMSEQPQPRRLHQSQPRTDRVLRNSEPMELEAFARENFWRFRNPVRSGVLGSGAPRTNIRGKAGEMVMKVRGAVGAGAGDDGDDHDLPKSRPAAVEDFLIPTRILFRRHSWRHTPRLNLGLWAPRVTDVTLVGLYPAFPHLVKLTMTRCVDLRPVGWNACIPTASRLTDLDLSHNTTVSDDGLLQLGLVCSSLKRLDISHTPLSSIAVAAVAYSSTGLVRVVCDHCVNVNTLAWLHVLPQLEYLSLDGCPSIEPDYAVDILRSTLSLQSLDLSGSDVNDAVVRDMVTTPRIRARRQKRAKQGRLSLTLASIQTAIEDLVAGEPDGLGARHQYPPLRLRRLMLRRCTALSSSGVVLLCWLSGRRLLHLDVSRGPALSLRAVAELVRHCPLLRRLGAAACSLEDVHLRALSRATKLEAVEVADNPDITDEGVRDLVTVCTRLSTVDVQGCTRLGDATAFALAECLTAANDDVAGQSRCRASQSSTVDGHNAVCALQLNGGDGGDPRDTGLFQSSRTRREPFPWWEVDLRRIAPVDTVEVSHRLHEHPAAGQFVLWIIASTQPVGGSTPKAAARSAVAFGGCVAGVLRGDQLAGGKCVVTLDVPVAARFVRIMLERTPRVPWKSRPRTSKSILRVTDCSLELDAVRVYRKGLRHVNLGETSVTDDGVRAVAAAFPRLQSFRIPGCMSVSDAAVRRVSQACTHLRVVDVSGSAAVTRISVQSLALNCPRLTELHASPWLSRKAREAGDVPLVEEQDDALPTTVDEIPDEVLAALGPVDGDDALTAAHLGGPWSSETRPLGPRCHVSFLVQLKTQRATGVTRSGVGVDGGGGGKRPPASRVTRALAQSLRFWGADDVSLRFLASGCPRLKVLDLAGHKKITDAGVNQFRPNTALTRLDLTLAPKVTDKGVRDLAKHSAGKQLGATIPPVVGPSTSSVEPLPTFRGVETNAFVVCQAAADEIVETEHLEWHSAIVVQRWWRQVRDFLIMQVQLGFSNHKRLDTVLRSMSGAHGLGVSPEEKVHLLAVGWAARTVSRWYRRLRFSWWKRAAYTMERTWILSRFRWRDRVRLTTIRVQAIVRTFLVRARLRHRMAAATCIGRMGRAYRHRQLCRKWRRWYMLRRDNLVRLIQSKFRAHQDRLRKLAASRRNARMMVLALLFWVINVNLKYLWGRKVLVRNQRRRLEYDSACTIQRAWVKHVVVKSMADGWGFVDKMHRKRARRFSHASNTLKAFIRRNIVRRKLLTRATTMAFHTKAARVIQRARRGRFQRDAGRAMRERIIQSASDFYGRTVNQYFQQYKPVTKNMTVLNGLTRWLVRARVRIVQRESSRLALWWRRLLRRRACHFANRQLLLYRNERLYSVWRAEQDRTGKRHARTGAMAGLLSQDVGLPLGEGDSVACRYYGGVHEYAGTVEAVVYDKMSKVYKRFAAEHTTVEPLHYRVRFTRDGVVDPTVKREWLRVTQYRMTQNVVTGLSRKVRSLWKTPPVVQRRPKQLTKHEATQMLACWLESEADFQARLDVAKTIGVVDVRIVVGREDNALMAREQVLRAAQDMTEVYHCVPLDLRARVTKDDVRGVHEPCHVWFLTGTTPPFVINLQVVDTKRLLDRPAHFDDWVNIMRTNGFFDVFWPNRRHPYALDIFKLTNTDPAKRFPPQPPAGVRLALAVEWGLCGPDDDRPVAELSAASIDAPTLMVDNPGIKSDIMLFAGRFSPLATDLGTIGLDPGTKLWVKKGMGGMAGDDDDDGK